MTETQERLGRMLLKGLVTLRENKGSLSLEDVGEMFMLMANNLNPSSSAADHFLHKEISRLAQYIDEAKREIFAISGSQENKDELVDASAHLDEVIKHTEEATNTIMDAADSIQAAAGGIGGEKEAAISDAVSRIYESCNFQDITGQRITKVIKLMANIEERVAKLNELFGREIVANDKVVPVTAIDDKELLNGPQLSSKAATQEEIDMLFASLGGKK